MEKISTDVRVNGLWKTIKEARQNAGGGGGATWNGLAFHPGGSRSISLSLHAVETKGGHTPSDFVCL